MSAATLFDFELVTCYKCAVKFGMPADLNRQRYNDHRSFWCPNGHEQHYVGKTADQQRIAALERELRDVRADRDWIADERDRAKTDARGKAVLLGKEKAKRARIEARIAHGVCPCCNRTFKQLAQHMAAKHPEYQERKRPRRKAKGAT